MGHDNSDFHDDWSDRQAAERYALHARELYDQYRKYHERAIQSHIEYAKWILASLLAVHGGMIYGISGLRSTVPQEMRIGLVGAAGWSLMGIGCTLVVGFFVWLNFQSVEQHYSRWINPATLYSRSYWPKNERRFDPIAATMLLSVAFGMLSALCFAFSATKIIATLSS